MKGLFFGSIFFCICSCAPTISGKITGPQGELIEPINAKVNVTSLTPSEKKEAKIFLLDLNSKGEFYTKDDLDPGEYLIEALVPGYKIMSQKIKVPQTQELKLKLTPLSKTDPVTIRANTQDVDGKGAGDATLMPPHL